jgi:HD-like signal output (HDOD) protein
METDDTYRIMTTLANIEHIGAPPDLTMRLFDLVKNDDANFEDIARLIVQNPPVCASLLKLANSVYYSRGVAVATVSQAIAHLGIKAVVNFVLGFEMIGVFHGRDDVSHFDLNAFWKSSLAGAMLAQEIAGKLGVEDSESVFLSGLLRDIGVLVIRQYFPDIFERVCDLVYTKNTSFDDACISACFFDHRHIAFLLALRWNLPKKILFTFQPPTEKLWEYEAVMFNRNIVIFSDFMLKMKQIFPWDANSKFLPMRSYSFDLPSDFIEETIARVVSDVNEFSRHF